MGTTLVTGAGGFIATHVIRRLRRAGAERIVGIDVRPMSGAPVDEWQTVDLTDPPATLRAVVAAAPDVVFHLVGGIRGSNEFVTASNVDTARCVLEALRQAAPGARVVLVGSAAEYGVVPLADQPVRETFVGKPAGAYGKAKAQVSELALAAARQFGQHVAVARPFNVIGAGVPETLVAGAIVQRLRAALAGPTPRSITIGRTDSVRDFVAVDDVASGMMRIAERGRPGESYNLCTGEGHSIAELLDRLLAHAGEPVVVQQDEALLQAGEVDAIVGSPEKAERELGWKPATSFESGVAATWNAR
jgi:GDP-4-dehydro-6-deoxy-D-mannose reductase